jgi:prepilin-type N-terminal cleavage/methylation domain-containing protein
MIYLMKLFSALKRNISSSLPKSKSGKGFTLIELLVVIGILGILAAALVATIDPFEQLKKAADTNTTNALVEYIDGVTRYYTTHTAYPWDSTVDNGAGCNNAIAPDGTKALNNPDMETCTTALIGDNELKDAFKTSDSLKNIYITYDATNRETIGCFNPQSKSLLHNGNTKFDVTGNPAAAGKCDTTAEKDANPSECFWCTR